METKDLEPVLTGITEIKAAQKTNEAAVVQIDTAVKTLDKDLQTIKTDTAEFKAWQVKKDETDKANQEWIDSEQAKKQRGLASTKQEAKAFNEYLSDAIEGNADKIRNFRKGDGVLNINLMPEVKAKDGKDVEVKTVGDMSMAANFPGADSLYRDLRGPLIESPYNRVWIADLLPQGTSKGTSVLYPKTNSGEGAAAVWASGNKAQIDYDFTSTTAPFKTIAGVVIIERQMLDDIDWMNSFLQQYMLVSLKTAENALILNGDDTGTVLPGLEDVASPYNGTFTASTITDAIKKIIDAAYGQIPDATQDWHRGNLVILNGRDQVNLGLNTATGSGEFDLPAGSVAFSNGTLIIGGLRTVGISAPTMPSDTFYALDTNATMVIRRMQPELRLFESADLARKNQVMFRIEERLTLLVFNNAAVIKGVLITS